MRFVDKTVSSCCQSFPPFTVCQKQTEVPEIDEAYPISSLKKVNFVIVPLMPFTFDILPFVKSTAPVEPVEAINEQLEIVATA